MSIKTIETIKSETLVSTVKSGNNSKLFNLVNSADNDSVKIDSSISLSSLFKLDNVDLSIMTVLFRMSETNRKTFSEIKQSTDKVLKSGLAIGNSTSGTSASFYKWSDTITDERIKKLVLLTGSLLNIGYNIVVNKNNELSVTRTTKASLLKATFYKNDSLINEETGQAENVRVNIEIKPALQAIFKACIENPINYQKFIKDYKEVKLIDDKTGKIVISESEKLKEENRILKSELSKKDVKEVEANLPLVSGMSK